MVRVGGRTARAGLIGEQDARELRFLSAFGRLIANTDMHFGNASFSVTRTDVRASEAFRATAAVHAQHLAGPVV